MKEISIRQMAQIKRTAQNVQPMVTKIKNLEEKIKVLQEEINMYNTQVDAWESAVKALTGGYTSSDLVTKVVEETGKTDKNGKPVKVTKFEPSDLVSHDPAKNVYVITSLQEQIEKVCDEYTKEEEVEEQEYSEEEIDALFEIEQEEERQKAEEQEKYEEYMMEHPELWND